AGSALRDHAPASLALPPRLQAGSRFCRLRPWHRLSHYGLISSPLERYSFAHGRRRWFDREPVNAAIEHSDERLLRIDRLLQQVRGVRKDIGDRCRRASENKDDRRQKDTWSQELHWSIITVYDRIQVIAP